MMEQRKSIIELLEDGKMLRPFFANPEGPRGEHPSTSAERGAELSLACSLGNQLELFIRVVSLQAKRKAP